MKAGDTFVPLMRNAHLWAIVSNPEMDCENVVLVNLTTYTIDEESHCVLHKGDHPFVKHKTAVRYEEARLASVASLTILLKNQVEMRERLSATVLRRIREGAALSDRIPEKCRQILEKQGLI